MYWDQRELDTLGHNYNEFGYKEHLAIANRFLCIKITDCNIKQFGTPTYNKQFLLHLFLLVVSETHRTVSPEKKTTKRLVHLLLKNRDQANVRSVWSLIRNVSVCRSGTAWWLWITSACGASTWPCPGRTSSRCRPGWASRRRPPCPSTTSPPTWCSTTSATSARARACSSIWQLVRVGTHPPIVNGWQYGFESST